MPEIRSEFIGGGCVCGEIHYRLHQPPLFVHCCHCRYCQRETGTSFALNALIESDQLDIIAGATEVVDTPSQSGAGQRVHRCPRCRVALWSHYASAGPLISFVRVGTLDDPDQCPPDIHIFVSSKQRWIDLPETAVAMQEYYRRSEHWPSASLERFEELKPRILAWRALR